MITKEQQYKLLGGRIDTMQNLALECIELLSNALWNDAIETAAKLADDQEYGHEAAVDIRRLKK